jgi:phage pi2 protein 07
MLSTEFKELFYFLTEQPYEAHWFHTIPAEQVLIKGTLCDCSDRIWVLADWCETNNISYELVWSLITTPTLSLHVAIQIEGYIYDPIFKAYEMPYNDYKKVIGANIYLKTGGWIRRII